MARDDNAWAARTAERARRALRPHGFRTRVAPPDPRADVGENTVDGPAHRAVDEVIGDCAVYEGGRRKPGTIPLEQASRAAQQVHANNGFVWIGLQQPTAANIATVAEEFSLPALAVEDAVLAHQRSKLEVYDDVVFVVLKPVRYVDHEEVVDITEIALFVGPNFVVSVRHGQSDVLRRVRQELDAGRADDAQEDAPLHAHGPTGVLYRAADLVVDGYEEALVHIDEDVDEIETQVFDTSDSWDDNSQRIYKLKREIAEFRRAVQPLAIPLQRLADGDVPGVDPEAGTYFRDVHDHVLRAADAIDNHDHLLSDVLQADLARVAVRQSQIAIRQNEIAVRQNEDMRKISAWAAIALVPTAIAGIYGMNFDNMPELRWKYGYFLVLAVIGGMCGALYRAFRKNGWL